MKTKYWRILKFYFIGWFIATLLRELLRTSDHILLHLTYNTLIPLISWVSSALCFGLLHIFIDRYIKGRVPFIRLSIVTLLLQVLVIFIILIPFFYFFRSLGLIESNWSLSKFILQPLAHVAFIYAIITNFTIVLFIYINTMLGGTNLQKMITGKFYTPKVDEYVFMFLDLRGSTTIAEKLGHIKYSRLIQDCFYDIAVVHDYGAEIYQYVGDEAVLVWKARKGYDYLNCVKAFYGFKDRLKERTTYYLDNYNVLPEFKAGLNIGLITITEVGEFKREIAYHGDTINTAARIQGECNRLNSELLLSEKLINLIKLEPWLTSGLKGKIQLKGKSEVVPIYAVNRV